MVEAIDHTEWVAQGACALHCVGIAMGGGGEEQKIDAHVEWHTIHCTLPLHPFAMCAHVGKSIGATLENLFVSVSYHFILMLYPCCAGGTTILQNSSNGVPM